MIEKIHLILLILLTILMSIDLWEIAIKSGKFNKMTKEIAYVFLQASLGVCSFIKGNVILAIPWLILTILNTIRIVGESDKNG